MPAQIYQFSHYFQSGRYSGVIRAAKHIQQHLDEDPILALFALSQALLDLTPQPAFKTQDKSVLAAYHQFLNLYQTETNPKLLAVAAAALITACYHPTLPPTPPTE